MKPNFKAKSVLIQKLLLVSDFLKCDLLSIKV